MKSAVIVVLFRLFTIGVFVDGNEESVSVTEGGSVTLKSGVTERQTDEGIEWRFSGTRIAKISRDSNEIWVKPDGSFKDRLQLDNQTGDLKISNIRTTDSGEYKVKISSPRGSSEMTFTVKVVSADKVKSVSVLEGDSVTLQTGLADTLRYDEIQWRYGQQKSSGAEINRTAGIFNTSDVLDERFRGRLQLDKQTGSLTIKNMRTRHSGLYEVEISSTSSRYTRHYKQSFNVTVSDAVKSLSVIEEDSVTLLTVTELQNDDQIWWMFEEIVIAEINKADQRFSTSDGPDERFRDRLQLDHQTGSLTITNIRTTDAGLYEVKISGSRRIINRRIIVSVGPVLYPATIALIVVVGVLLVAVVAAVVIYRCNKISQPKWSWKTLSVIEGETVPLIPSGTEFSKEDNIRWLLNKSPLAEIKRKSPEPFNILHENFKDRLYWPKNLGPLNIENIRFQDSGLYELQIIRPENNIQTLELFMVVVFARTDDIKIKEVKEGGSVTLESGVTGIQKDDEILWKFGLDIPIAAIQGGRKKTPPFGSGWRSIFRLKLDKNGSLTIRNVGRLQAGFYALHITRSGNASLHLFRVKISNECRKNESPPSGHYVNMDSEVIQMLKEPSKTQQSNEYEDPNSEVIQMLKEPSKTQQCKSAGSGPKSIQKRNLTANEYEDPNERRENESSPSNEYEDPNERRENESSPSNEYEDPTDDHVPLHNSAGSGPENIQERNLTDSTYSDHFYE